MERDELQQVVVTDIRMPFLSMVVFMIKWAVASVPALLVLGLVGSLLMTLMTLLMGGHGFMGGGVWHL